MALIPWSIIIVNALEIFPTSWPPQKTPDPVPTQFSAIICIGIWASNGAGRNPTMGWLVPHLIHKSTHHTALKIARKLCSFLIKISSSLKWLLITFSSPLNCPNFFPYSFLHNNRTFYFMEKIEAVRWGFPHLLLSESKYLPASVPILSAFSPVTWTRSSCFYKRPISPLVVWISPSFVSSGILLLEDTIFALYHEFLFSVRSF